MGVRIEPQVRMLENRPRASGRFRILIAVCAPVALSTSTSAQTLEEVRQAVEAYFGPDAESEPARESFSRWGNAALVHLRSLSRGSIPDFPARRFGHEIVCAAMTVGTEDALDFIVEVLDGRTPVNKMVALGVVYDYFRQKTEPDPRVPPSRQGQSLWPAPSVVRVHLQEHSRFKPAVQRFAESGSWLDKCHAAEIAATSGWKDFEPLLVAMLEDKNVELRRRAAAALLQLTGRQVEVDLPHTTFPEERLIPDLVREPVLLQGGHVERVSEVFLMHRGSDAPALMFGDGSTFAAYPWTEGSDQISFVSPVVHVLQLDVEPHQLVALAWEARFAGSLADHVVSLNEAGEELWRYQPPRRGFRAGAAAVLYGERGPYGIAIGPGSDTGLVGVDAFGEILWDVPEIYIIYDLETHRDLPGIMLIIGGSFVVAEHAFDKITGARDEERSSRRTQDYVYADTGVLFPGPDGDAEMILAGRAKNSDSVVHCFDNNYERKWTIRLSDRVSQLEMLEVGGRERLFAITTGGGDLILVDESGALRWRGRLPDTMQKNPHRVFELVAGSYDGNKAAVALRTPEGYFLYPINVEALPLAR